MSAGEEQQIIKQYQPLIRALIPYEQQNRLLEGINKFSKRLPGNIRKIIKEEVVRLTSLTDASADNSAFAKFPVMKFKHFGIPMRLDKVGAKILQNETALYQERYTVGVFESVMNSDFYQTQIKRDQFKKIVEAFNVESQSFTDIDFGDDIAVRPNFTVSSVDFEKGRHCTVSSLSFTGIAVETKRPPNVTTGDIVTFVIPEVMGLTTEPTEITYELDAIKYNKHLGKYESFFTISSETDLSLLNNLKRYIKGTSYKQPLQRDLEIERAMQDLERDRILENSPWLPVFLSAHQKSLKPIIALFTKANVDNNNSEKLLASLQDKAHFENLVQELKKYNEAFIFHGVIKTKSGAITITATHRQLVELGQLNAIIYLLVKSGEFTCTQCRLEDVSREDKVKAFAIHDIPSKEFEHLAALSHVMYCRDISMYLTNLTLSEKCDFKPLSKTLRASGDNWSIDFVMEDDLDRRSETRYIIDKAAMIKVGLLSSIDVRVADLSASGMKLMVAPGTELQSEVRVSVPDLKIKNEKYKVVHYDATSGVVRLCLEDVKNSKAGASVDAMVEENTAYFKIRDIARIQRSTHRFIWELAVRHMPSLAVLCVMNRHILDRLKTVYQSDSSDDLYPFSRTANIIPLHGFFADKAVAKPKSMMLEAMFKGDAENNLVVHCVRKSDNRLVYIKESDFLYSKLRTQIQNQLEEEKVQVSATNVTAIRCYGATTPLTKKRLAQLSKLDKAMYDKLETMQAGYTHCIFVTNMSALHHDLVMAKLIAKQERPLSEDEATA
ncbi:PilZ domain-containing protein [Alteromonas stellipolaris]|uniref:PilZ domain-containing protein n=1 Tax=Alteromonas stellipolaris TaxID=233316 RepID=UPI00273637C6|nr:PilZ domain-containing protein [Alteromonas stellipolaris]MDP2595982.1 PilZ domain-containing protein [Alteromonas stellipolaris]